MRKPPTPPDGVVAVLLTGGDHGNDTTQMIHKSPNVHGAWRTTRFDQTGEPYGHTDYSSLRYALETEIKWGARLIKWITDAHQIV